jgi:hypothetical protein
MSATMSFVVDTAIHASTSYAPYLRQALQERDDFQAIRMNRIRRRTPKRQLAHVGVVVSSDRNYTRGQVANRVRGTEYLTRKDLLAESIQRFHGDFFPPTYILRNGQWVIGPSKEELSAKQTIFCKNATKERGEGIEITNTLEECAKIAQYTSSVAQPEITSQLLGDKHKFDLRVFALIVNEPGHAPRFYMYSQGYLRVNCSDADKAQTEKQRLLTNVSFLAKHGGDFELILTEDWAPFADTVFPQIHRALRLTFGELHERLNRLNGTSDPTSTSGRSKCTKGSYQIFGVDFLVDKHDKCWLLEFNESPGMVRARHPPALQEQLQGMVCDMVDVAIAPLLQPPRQESARTSPDPSASGMWARVAAEINHGQGAQALE